MVKFSHRRRTHFCGFTLIEILVVMAIIATLLMLALPRYYSGVDKSRETVLMDNIKTLRDGIDKYRADTGKYPQTLDDLVAKQYFRTVPMDPITESSSTWILLPPPNSQEQGIYDIRSGATGKTRSGIDYKDL